MESEKDNERIPRKGNTLGEDIRRFSGVGRETRMACKLSPRDHCLLEKACRSPLPPGAAVEGRAAMTTPARGQDKRLKKPPAGNLPPPDAAKQPAVNEPGDALAAACDNRLWDKALGLLLEREESLLGDIVDRCRELVQVAEEQAGEMADFLDSQTH
jgi:hypothetical protein